MFNPFHGSARCRNDNELVERRELDDTTKGRPFEEATEAGRPFLTDSRLATEDEVGSTTPAARAPELELAVKPLLVITDGKPKPRMDGCITSSSGKGMIRNICRKIA